MNISRHSDSAASEVTTLEVSLPLSERGEATHVNTRRACRVRVDVNSMTRRSIQHTPPQMAAPTIYEDVVDVPGLENVGQLFAGKKFWVAQRVPARIALLDDIESNGGEIVKLEKLADYMIADHFRKDCPAGSISYQFVTKSIKEGQLQDPQDHRAGPPMGEAREPGAIHRPTKGGRAPYTPEEDRILYKWVRDFTANGGAESGNEIYKQLEAKVCVYCNTRMALG